MTRAVYICGAYPFPATGGGKISDAGYTRLLASLFDEVDLLLIGKGAPKNNDTKPDNVNVHYIEDHWIEKLKLSGGGNAMMELRNYGELDSLDLDVKLLELKPDFILSKYNLKVKRGNQALVVFDYPPVNVLEETGNHQLYKEAVKVFDEVINNNRVVISPSAMDSLSSGGRIRFSPPEILLREPVAYTLNHPVMLFSCSGGWYRGKRDRKVVSDLFCTGLGVPDLKLYLYSSTAGEFLDTVDIDEDSLMKLPFERKGYRCENVTFSFLPTTYQSGIPSKLLEALSKGIPCIVPTSTKTIQFDGCPYVLPFDSVEEIPALIKQAEVLRSQSSDIIKWLGDNWNTYAKDSLTNIIKGLN